MRVCSSQPKVVVRNQERGSYSINGQTRLRRCTPSSVYRLIADCGSHVRWIPGLKSVLVHPAVTPDGHIILDEVHEINFLAFGKSFNTRLAMTANPANHTVRFDLLSSNLYRHYTTTFTTLPDTTSGTDSSRFANSTSSAALEHGVMGHLGSGDLDCPGGDVQPVDLDNATTVVRLEGSLAFQVAPPGLFKGMLRDSLETELVTTLANMEKELLRNHF